MHLLFNNIAFIIYERVGAETELEKNGIQKKWTTAFEQMYPDWMRDTELRDKYIEIAGSTTSELPEKIKLKLLRELASESTLGKKELCHNN